ncbi:unnamed protein product [Brassicogethes aeneus]|uniref:Carbohydrate sulfotransferase n=1 Tax=Brassicogethes aeneus TaxID=1431903 RepID=A0A9P0FEA2_BRAAE|nr:unnamed protein product [Brassicogethes aeneus]
MFLLCYVILLLIYLVKGDDSYPWLNQVLRQEKLYKNCDVLHLKRDYLDTNTLDHILVDHKHKLLYCYVPKIACTNWKRVLMVLTNQSNASNLVDIPSNLVHSKNATVKLSDLDKNLAKKCLETYTTFLMVRHPFERILSAYRNKFNGNYTNSKYFQKRYGKHILKNYRKDATKQELKSGANVTFREFVKFLLNEGQQANEHWTPIFNLCQPCAVNYTFVGRYETLPQDSNTLLHMIGAPPIVFPATRIEHTSVLLRSFMQELSIMEIKHLYKLYEYDFRLFGYNLEGVLGFDLA